MIKRYVKIYKKNSHENLFLIINYELVCKTKKHRTNLKILVTNFKIGLRLQGNNVPSIINTVLFFVSVLTYKNTG